MKPKTFTYNQIITFFVDNKLPLSTQQIQLIGMKVKEEYDMLQEYRAKERAKRDKKFIQRQKRKQKRLFRDGGGDTGKSESAVNMNPSNGI